MSEPLVIGRDNISNNPSPLHRYTTIEYTQLNENEPCCEKKQFSGHIIDKNATNFMSMLMKDISKGGLDIIKFYESEAPDAILKQFKDLIKSTPSIHPANCFENSPVSS